MASFKEAFAAARAAKKATFTWNGKDYTTQMKGEAAGMTKGPKARPKQAGSERPKARPSNKGPEVMSEGPKQGKAPAAAGAIKTMPASAGKRPPAKPVSADKKPVKKEAAGGGFGDKKQNSFISTIKNAFTGKGGWGDRKGKK